jgi:anthranilate phosphoribosyltransferase
MCNPASVKRQVIGVSDPTKVVLIGEALIRSGSQKVVLVNSQDGLDEISPAAPTAVNEWDGSRVKSYTIKPEDFGFKTRSLNDILGGNSAENAKILLDILNGSDKGPKREAVIMNASAGFYAAGMASSIVEGKSFAEASIDSGEAMAALEALKKASNL